MSITNTPVAVEGANISCVSGWLRVRGNINALSDHQKALITQTSLMNPLTQTDVCSGPTTDRYSSTGQNFLHWNKLAPQGHNNGGIWALN